MKDIYIASLCRHGILGGAIYITGEDVIFRTNKLTVPPRYRNLRMPISEIVRIDAGRLPILPTVSIGLKGGAAYRFVVFRGKRLVQRIEQLSTGRE